MRVERIVHAEVRPQQRVRTLRTWEDLCQNRKMDSRLVSEASPAVFFSYSHQDAATTVAIVEALEKRGLSVWYDRQRLQAGESIVGEIDQALKRSSHVIVLASAAYKPSSFAYDHEFAPAIAARKHIIPILHGAEASELPSVILSANLGISSDAGPDAVGDELVRILRPSLRRMDGKRRAALALALADLLPDGNDGDQTPLGSWHSALLAAEENAEVETLLSRALEKASSDYSPAAMFLSAARWTSNPDHPAPPERSAIDKRVRSLELEGFTAGAHRLASYALLHLWPALLRDPRFRTLAANVSDDGDDYRDVALQTASLRDSGHFVDPALPLGLAATLIADRATAADAHLLAGAIADAPSAGRSALALAARWSPEIRDAIGESVRRAAATPVEAAPSKRSAALRTAISCLAVLREAGTTANDLRDLVIGFAMQCGSPEDAVRAAEAVADSDPATFDALWVRTGHPAAAAAVRRLVQDGAPADSLPPRLQMAVCSALPSATRAELDAVRSDERVLEAWLDALGPVLNREQYALLSEVAEGAHPGRSSKAARRQQKGVRARPEDANG